MVLRLRKTLSDVQDRIKRLSGGLLEPKPKRQSSYEDDDNSDDNNNTSQNKIQPSSSDYYHLHGFRESRKSKNDLKIRRRLTVTGCDGHQVVCADDLWYYNDHTETTIDRHGIKTTSFCSSHL